MEESIQNREWVKSVCYMVVSNLYEGIYINEYLKIAYKSNCLVILWRILDFCWVIPINCWHMNEHESAAMWNLYSKSNEGIAIQSKYAKLKKSLIDDEEIFLGKVKYINYDTEFIDGKYYILSPFFYKRKSFEHEQEVRAIVTKWPIDGSNIDFTQETIRHGMEIKVDIETLIERIYVAPSAPDWFADIVKAVVTKYGYNFNIVHSKLNENPVF